jgi:hypothetical protein
MASLTELRLRAAEYPTEANIRAAREKRLALKRPPSLDDEMELNDALRALGIKG